MKIIASISTGVVGISVAAAIIGASLEAQAQDIGSYVEKTVMCTAGEHELWFEAGSICHANPFERMKPAHAFVPMSSVTLAKPSCPKDRTLVMVDDRTAKCAKDLTDPE